MLTLTLAGAIFLVASLGLLARREVDLSFLAAGACSLCCLAAGIVGHMSALTALGAAGVALPVFWWGGPRRRKRARHALGRARQALGRAMQALGAKTRGDTRTPRAANARTTRRAARALAVTTLAVATCLAAVPGAQAAPPAPAAGHISQPSAPVITYLSKPVKMTTMPQQAPGAATACTSNCRLYIICLSHVSPTATHCLSWDSGVTGVVISAVSLGIQVGQILWKIIANRSGDSTEEDDGVYKGKHEKPSLVRSCLGANPTRSDTNDRVYFSSPSKCFGVARQSWAASADSGRGNYDYYSLAALNEGRNYQLVGLNLRNGAFAYAKDEGGGIWSTWSWYWVATCTSNC